MANKDFYKASEVPQFQEEVCKNTCIMKGKCIDDGRDSHWFLMCPHYHQWKLGYSSFVTEQIQWERDHPEEVEAKRQKNLELSKSIREARKTAKKK